MYLMDGSHQASDATVTAYCRLCDQNTAIMYSIFDKNIDGQQILHLIRDCLPLIVIYRTDPLSKFVCNLCVDKLNALSQFKLVSLATAKQRRSQLYHPNNDKRKDIQLYLECCKESSTINNNDDTILTTQTVSTSTDDLTIICKNCKSPILEPSLVNNEIELCAELHKAIADSLISKTNQMDEDPATKVLRATSTRRRRSQAFYHELDDSMCSSLTTEFTMNTESSQCYEEDERLQNRHDSDMDVEDSYDDSYRVAKRRRIDDNDCDDIIVTDHNSQSSTNISQIHDEDLMLVKREASYLKDVFEKDVEIRYYPLSLMQLTLNVLNKMIVEDYRPVGFSKEIVQPKCTYCCEQFKNTKLLAMHEIEHINIELGEKVDNPVPWHESRDDSLVRNKWLTYLVQDPITPETNYFNNNCVVKNEIIINNDNKIDETMIINDNGNKVPSMEETARATTNGSIVIVATKAMVNGILLSDYTKEERKTFYPSMRIGGVNKKFCLLCRYCFKDNWSMEGHYFTSACYYTCRYCGMRFNKQRHRFDEHVQEHVDRNEPISTKVYTTSKVNKFLPKIIKPDQVTNIIVPNATDQDNNIKVVQQPLIKMMEPVSSSHHHLRRSLQKDLMINVKEEVLDDDDELMMMSSNQTILNNTTSSSSSSIIMKSKSTNQAYFCRKCYKVFFKLDEFNVHSKLCDYNQFPPTRIPYDRSNPKRGSSNNSNNVNKEITSNGDLISPTGRPLRNCVREIGTYKDEAFVPDTILKDTNPQLQLQQQQQQQQNSFVCTICGTPFPTIYSRNSHMRIHKGESAPSTSHHYKLTRQQQQQSHNTRSSSVLDNNNLNYYNNITDTIIKREPLEPEVQIHEEIERGGIVGSSSSSSIGAVSITPICKNPNQKATINPNIMKLVQNNPHLTIKANMNESPPPPTTTDYLSSSSAVSPTGTNDADRSYKCSNCWGAFANKSHLYFHKKNQCEGSKYPCPFCKKRFGTESAYSSHIFYSHPE